MDWSLIRLIVCDFDGVLTDNRVWVLDDGREAVVCHRGDGMGIEMLRKRGLEVIVLSKETNPVVQARCAKLEIPCVHGLEQKLEVFEQAVSSRGLDFHQVVYVGNDVNDLECLERAGIGVVVADAHPDVLPIADFILSRNGGDGAIRELCDLLLANRNQ